MGKGQLDRRQVFSAYAGNSDRQDRNHRQRTGAVYHSPVRSARLRERVFLVGWVDYHPTFNFNKQSELEANRDNFVKGVGATLLSTRTTTIDGYQALEFKAENEEKIFTSRVYMVGRRPYQIVIGLPKGQDNAASVDLFLNSFKVALK